MAFDAGMVDAVSNTPASSGEYNKLIDNILDLNTRTLASTSAIADGTSGNAALAAKVNSGTIGNTPLGAKVNDATKGNDALSAKVNSGTIGNTALGALVNDASVGNTALDSRVDALEAGSSSVGSWVAITAFSNSWVNRTGGSFYTLKVRTLPGNNIEIVGTLSRTGTPVSGETICTLPSTLFYPTQETYVPITLTSGAAGSIQILPSGLVKVFGTTTVSIHIVAIYPGPSSGA